TRTPVFAVRGRRPGPLDEGSDRSEIAVMARRRKEPRATLRYLVPTTSGAAIGQAVFAAYSANFVLPRNDISAHLFQSGLCLLARLERCVIVGMGVIPGDDAVDGREQCRNIAKRVLIDWRPHGGHQRIKQGPAARRIAIGVCQQTRAKTKLPQIEKENGFVLAPRFPQAL